MELFTREVGEGEPLLILHGLFGSSVNWLSIAKALSGRFRVLGVDLRNHGQSPHAPSMTYEDMVDDVLEVLQARGLKQVRLLGHSMGGKVSMSLALAHPERVSKLVVVDIAPVTYAHDHADLLQAMRDLDLSALHRREDADRLLSAAIPERPLRQFLLKNLISGEQGFHWQINLPALTGAMRHLFEFPVPAGAQPFTGPTLFVGGADSHYIRRPHYPEIYRWFPRAELRLIPGAGHWVHAEQPAAFLELVRPFLG